MKVIQVQVNMLCILTMRKTWQLQFDIISFIKGSFAMSWYFTGEALRQGDGNHSPRVRYVPHRSEGIQQVVHDVRLVSDVIFQP